jgi:hypothetical protein
MVGSTLGQAIYSQTGVECSQQQVVAIADLFTGEWPTQELVNGRHRYLSQWIISACRSQSYTVKKYKRECHGI